MNAKALSLFYKIKPLMPRSIQLLLRSYRAKKIYTGMDSPYLLGRENDKAFPIPKGYDSVILLTHDIETKAGFSMIKNMRKIELDEGVPSTWNFVLDKYGTHPDLIKSLKGEGCECGAHGLTHDGKLFENNEVYNERMKRLIDISNNLGLTGFRSPALHRNTEWMQTLPFKWDSSFPAWDPFQPQPGGCEKYAPFKINDKTWELPVTLFQDFTLFYELKEKSIDIWKEQANALAHRKMLINIIVHPDYMNELTLPLYQAFIEYCKAELNSWITTPSELCDWLDGHE